MRRGRWLRCPATANAHLLLIAPKKKMFLLDDIEAMRSIRLRPYVFSAHAQSPVGMLANCGNADSAISAEEKWGVADVPR
jgi:hypothetical protein